MKGKGYKYLLDTIENEGFDYAFHSYSDFKDVISDPEFHRLREAYLKARSALVEYIGTDGNDL